MCSIRNSVSNCCLGRSLKQVESVVSVLIMVGANTTARLRAVILFVSLCCTTLVEYQRGQVTEVNDISKSTE